MKSWAIAWVGIGLLLAAPLYSAPPNSVARGGGEILRVVLDSSTGNRWLLERDPVHPGGPGRLLLVSPGKSVPIGEERRDRAASAPEPTPIHAGDPVLLVAHTAVMDAELEAVALAPAQAGAEFAVRLRIGGRVLRARALGAGRAQWIAAGGARP